MALGLPGFITLLAKPSNSQARTKSSGLWVWPLIFCPLLLSGCVAPLAALGTSSTAAASSVGTAVTTAAVANPVTATSLASTATTGKSPLEHAASAATKKECSFMNVLDSKPICVEVIIPPVTDKSEVYLGPADRVDKPPK